MRLNIASFMLSVGSMVSPATAHSEAATKDVEVSGTDALTQEIREHSALSLGKYVGSGQSSFAVAILVQNGRTTYEQAWGVEDADSKIPVSIDTTLLDLNSLEKVFTAVSLAQLVDSGAIRDIEEPVNAHLVHYQLPKVTGRDVTIREVATHNAGFDESQFGAGELSADPPRYFKQAFPGYFANIGTYSSYSSYGSMLLGYLVSETSGRPFVRYVDQAILEPLGMHDTFFAEPGHPLSHRIRPFRPSFPDRRVPLEALNTSDEAFPADQAVATARDMSRFMIALLGDEPSAAATITPKMRELLFSIHQSNGDWGSAHGLMFDAIRSGSTTLYTHGGRGDGLNCQLALDPSRHAGLFFCYGDVHGRFDTDPALFPPAYERVKSDLLEPFVTCAPGTNGHCPDYGKTLESGHDWDRYLGYYVAYARHHHGVSILRTLIHPTAIEVRRGSGASLDIDDVDGYVEIAPHAFGKPGVLETFTFVNDPATGGTVLSGSGRPTAYERPDLLENPRIIPLLLAVMVAIALSGGLLALVPRYGIAWSLRLPALAYAAIVTMGVVALFGLHAYGQPYFDGVSWPLNLLRVLAFLCMPAGLWLLVARWRVERSGQVGLARIGLLHYDLVCTSALVMVLCLLDVGLISFGHVT